MPTKISQLSPTTSVSALDLIPIVDVEDPLMALSGSNRSVTASNLANQLASLTTVVPAAVQTSLNLKAPSASPALTGSITIVSNSSNGAALRITQTGSAHALLVEDKENPDSTPFTINADGRVIVGSTVTAVSSSNVSSNLHIIGSSDDTSSINLGRYSADALSSSLYFSKSRSVTPGLFTLVANGDSLGSLHFDGSCNGFKQTRAASIVVQVDGTPGVDDMPGRIVFSTTSDGSNMPVERLRISNSGMTTLTGTGIINSNSTGAALSITQSGSGNALVVEDSTNPDSTPFIIDSSGNILKGITSQIPINDVIPGVQIASSGSLSGSGSSLNLTRCFGDSWAPTLSFAKSRNAAAVAPGVIVQTNDDLGNIVWVGDNGTDFSLMSARISAYVEGAPTPTSVPGRLVFSTTANGAGSAAERMRISSTGNVGIGTTTPDAKLTVSTSSDNAALRITQNGTGYALVVEDATGDSSPFIISTNGHVGVGAVPEVNGITLSHNGDNGVRSKSFLGTNVFSGYRANGTQASPTVAANNNPLVEFDAWGYGTSSYAKAAGISIAVDGSTISNSSMPGRIVFSTTPSDAIIPVERLRISNSGVTTLAGTGIINSNSTSAALRITQNGSGHSFQVEDETNDSSSFIIDSGGRILKGITSPIPINNITHGVQIAMAATTSGASLNLTRCLDDAGAPVLSFAKSRNAAAVAPGAIVQTDDDLGNIIWAGDNGVDFSELSASIGTSVDGVPSLSAIPGRLVFRTTDGVGNNAERMRVSSTGNIGIGTATTAAAKLTVSDASTQEALRVIQTGTGNALVVHDVANDTTPFIVDASGQVAINGAVNNGSGLTVNGTGDSPVALLGNGFVGLNIQAARNDAGDHAMINLWGSRGTIATKTAVSDGDILGTLSVRGWDGNSWTQCASVRGEVDGAVSDEVVPGRLTFLTRNGGTITERMRITSGGAVGIGTTNPVTSAKLEVTSTTSGFLPPRMTTTQRGLISSPAAGLMIYNTTSNKLNFHNGTAWQEVTSTTAP